MKEKYRKEIVIASAVIIVACELVTAISRKNKKFTKLFGSEFVNGLQKDFEILDEIGIL